MSTVSDRYTAAGMLLDLVSSKLNGDDRMAFDVLVYALVLTEQLGCARKLDEQLTERYLQDQDRSPKHGWCNFNLKTTRNTFCVSCLISKSTVNSITHARNGHISTSALKSDVTIVFLDDLAINKGYIAHFSLCMCETAVFPLPD